jgi:ABC-type lipoprotein export system ATPase subunit
MEHAIEAIDVGKVYGGAGAPVQALRGVHFHVDPAERVALLGKSGSGKSTLLNLLGGLDRPTSGRIHVHGRDLASLNANQRAEHRLKSVGMVFQSYQLIATRTALQNVELPLVFAGMPPSERRAAAGGVLEAVGLGDRLHHRPSQLSGGEKQRVAIARALVNRPSVLLADEPTGNLDSATAAEIIEVLLRIVAEHDMTLMVVTHDLELARTMSHRIIRLVDGQLAEVPA